MDIDRKQKESLLEILNNSLSMQRNATDDNDYQGEMINLAIRESIIRVLGILGFYVDKETDSDGDVVRYTDIRRKI